MLVGLTLVCACHDEPLEPPPSLAETSQEVQFASVDRLGPHHLLSTITTTESRDGREVSSAEETVEIRWQDWDHFVFSRTRDGHPVSAVTVAGSHAWLRRTDGAWVRKDDAEPYRIQLRTTWNTWDQALELFADRIALTEQGADVVEGRSARVYAVSLAPLPELPPGTAARVRAAGQPVSLAGRVWIDEATAVRLQADVRGVFERGNRTREISLKLTRSAVGQDQGISRPVRNRGRVGTTGAPDAADEGEDVP